MPSLMSEIRAFKVARGSVAAWWLGQNGFIFKTPEGTLAGVDLYLTNSCDGIAPGVDLSRKVPVLIEPEDVQLDVYTCTHNHQDHTDPETIRRLRSKDTMQFIGPHPSCDVFRREGIESGRIVPAWPDCDIEHKDVRIRGTYAVPTDDTDLNHIGFVFEFGGGPRIYVTGDTDYHELLLSVAKHKPDVMITCINGGFNNLSHWEAADLAGKVKPRAAIPCHYDMFPDNSVDPKQFEAALKLKAPDVSYLHLEHGRPVVIER
ncbi:MAG TPA: MBL fold metallo-hydrolase [Bryobacteraceae bacterium]|nr:MBL fold metallo-hydrolase [Bryobacteraceae bacterium]